MGEQPWVRPTQTSLSKSTAGPSRRVTTTYARTSIRRRASLILVYDVVECEASSLQPIGFFGCRRLKKIYRAYRSSGRDVCSSADHGQNAVQARHPATAGSSSPHAGVLATLRAFRSLGVPDLIDTHLPLRKRQRGFTEAMRWLFCGSEPKRQLVASDVQKPHQIGFG